MNTKQLYKALTCNVYTEPCFGGIFSRDTLKDITIKPKLIIVNTDPSYKPGKHWVLFYFNGDNVEFFDSLGKDLKSYGYEFVRFANRFAHTVNYAKVRTQPKNSILCGHYCLFYAYFRCKGKTMNSIIQKMIKIKSIKDSVKKIFTICKGSKCSLLQYCIPL